MKLFPLIWSNLWRRKLRTLFTLAAALFTFALFGILAAVNLAFGMGVDVSGADRLVVIHKISLIMPLPISYGGRIAAVPGVSAVTHMNWFGGIYKDPKNFFAQMAVDTPTFFDLYPEYVVPPDQKKAWDADRAGAIVGRDLAQRFGWKIGDKVPIQGTIFRRKDGSAMWDFNIDGIYEPGKKGVDATQFFFHYDYLKEGSRTGTFTDMVGWYTVRIADPNRAAEISQRIDGLFANSPFETKSSTEKAFAQSFANQMGNIGAIVRYVVSAVLFGMLLVIGNTMSQAVRERTNELAVLKTLGFGNGTVLFLVIAESCLLAVTGAGLGLLFAWGVLAPLLGKALKQFLPVFYIPAWGIALGFGIALVLGVLTGLLPGIQAMRLRIVDALRKV
ncbi:MAG TPA: FtsX-like permease family protein [Thermoanaerobaculia bacterium]|jgi:putative ABC transport system permease protein|nr:FtsX-like permease family protein [Thermoanaerobaculia bacterium]